MGPRVAPGQVAAAHQPRSRQWFSAGRRALEPPARPPYRPHGWQGSGCDSPWRCGGRTTSQEGSGRRQAPLGDGGAPGVQAPLPAPCAPRIAPHTCPPAPPADPCASHAFPPPPPRPARSCAGVFTPSDRFLGAHKVRPQPHSGPAPARPSIAPHTAPAGPTLARAPRAAAAAVTPPPAALTPRFACGVCRPFLCEDLAQAAVVACAGFA